MSRDVKLNQMKILLKDFTESQSDVQGQIIIAYPAGIPIVSTWQGSIDPVLIGALCAAVKLTFHNLCLNLKKGSLKKLYVNGEYGRAIIQNSGPNAILTTIIDEEADFFRIAFGMSDLVIEIEKLLEKFSMEGMMDL